ncbi:MAG: flavin reductase family protein [Endomicrobiales bacterium]|nr:flavin reductase family protein [Endomicrobiales bacterium]
MGYILELKENIKMFQEISKDMFYRLINFGPCVLLLSGDDIKTNIAPIAWLTPINEDPAILGIAIAESHFTSKLIRKTSEFVVCIPDVKLLPVIKFCGSNSGQKIDKIRKLSLKTEPGKKTKVPHLKDCLGFIECRVKDIYNYEGVNFFVSNVLCAKVKKGMFNNNIISEKAKALQHIGSGIFSVLGKRIKF